MQAVQVLQRHLHNRIVPMEHLIEGRGVVLLWIRWQHAKLQRANKATALKHAIIQVCISVLLHI